MKKIVVVGQIPPPLGGQAIMIQRILEGRYLSVELHHVDMRFAKDMDDLGRWRLGKILEVLSVIGRIAYVRIRHGANVIYYPPSGSNLLPVLRDMVILICVRWMFSKTIFHFHAAGNSIAYSRMSGLMKILFRIAYFKPDISIQLSEHNPDDGGGLGAKEICIIPNGIPDDYALLNYGAKPSDSCCRILYVGLISESKGFLVLIDAIERVLKSYTDLRVTVVGKFSSEPFRNLVVGKIKEKKLQDYFEFTGVLTGRDKFNKYWCADIFCFPTFFESESFGLVALEAMEFGVPIVVTQWRGVQSLVREGLNGYAVPIKDSGALSEKILVLVHSPALRQKMGAYGRKVYLEEYTVEKFYQRMGECFRNI